MTIRDYQPPERIRGDAADYWRPGDPKTWKDRSVRDAVSASVWFVIALGALIAPFRGCGDG